MIVAPHMIAVDDNIEHLRALAMAFDSLGGLCHGLDVETALTRDVPYVAGVRILFMDINLLPGAYNNQGARTYAPIAKIIKQIISRKNGPYILITWTENEEAHDQLIDYLNQNLPDELKPVSDACLPKAGHLDDPEALKSSIGELQNNVPGLALLLDWERAVVKAADRSVNEIIQLTGKVGRDAGGEVERAVNSIATAAAGSNMAVQHPFRAFKQGMSGLLIDRLDYGLHDEAVEDAWRRRLSDPPPAAPGTDQKAALNTFLHIEANVDDLPVAPGTVYPVTVSQLLPFLRPEYSTGKSAILGNKFLPIKHDKLNTDEKKNAFAKSCRWCFVTLGAPCDYVNRKMGVLDGLIGLQVPQGAIAQTHLQHKNEGFRDTPAKHEWLFQTPPLKDSKGRYSLVFNFRYRVSFPLQYFEKTKPLLRIRESLSSEIATHSANFSTRPGIIEFRS